jgi:hypothetical protein
MTPALVEDSTGRLFSGQSTSHYSSAHPENRNTCFLMVVRAVGSAIRNVWSAASVDDKSQMHSLNDD